MSNDAEFVFHVINPEKNSGLVRRKRLLIEAKRLCLYKLPTGNYCSSELPISL